MIEHSVGLGRSSLNFNSEERDSSLEPNTVLLCELAHLIERYSRQLCTCTRGGSVAVETVSAVSGLLRLREKSFPSFLTEGPLSEEPTVRGIQISVCVSQPRRTGGPGRIQPRKFIRGRMKCLNANFKGLTVRCKRIRNRFPLIARRAGRATPDDEGKGYIHGT